MIYGSVCSGIEAATVAWHPLGWRPAFFSEIEPFPRAVLAYHYPNIPCHGDFTTIQAGDYEAIDLLCGGTPCQDFSVAGLRAGLAGKRGNLTIEFVHIIERLKPRWIVWENVPGILSIEKGAVFRLFLDMLEDLGYILDIDILDAQFHGVPQRRRRVFVCGHHRDDILLKQMTDSSALTIIQCLSEMLRVISIEAFSRFAIGQVKYALPNLSRDGVRRRIKLFGLDGESGSFEILLLNLSAALARYQVVQNTSDVDRGESVKEHIQDDPLMDSSMGDQSLPTEELLRKTLSESYEVLKSFITSTLIREITNLEIFICSQAVLPIAKLTLHLNRSSPCFYGAASSILMLLEAYTDYARQTVNSLFGDFDRFQQWCDFFDEAKQTSAAFRDIRVQNFGQISSLAESLRGNPAPSREAGKETARPARSRVKGGGDTANNLIAFSSSDNGRDAISDQCPPLGVKSGRGHGSGAAIAFGGNNQAGSINVATACNAHGGSHGRQDFESETFITHSLRADGFDASEDGTGRGTPLIAFSAKDHGADASDLSPTLRAGISSDAIDRSGEGDGSAAERAGLGIVANASPSIRARPNNGVATGMSVRRLTPKECARLQGFPDDYLDISYRGKPAADGNKYRALGNSMAVPVMRWLGERIQMVEELLQERETT